VNLSFNSILDIQITKLNGSNTPTEALASVTEEGTTTVFEFAIFPCTVFVASDQALGPISQVLHPQLQLILRQKKHKLDSYITEKKRKLSNKKLVYNEDEYFLVVHFHLSNNPVYSSAASVFFFYACFCFQFILNFHFPFQYRYADNSVRQLSGCVCI
jgi:hypothetical protein